jgi:hypothetical protein
MWGQSRQQQQKHDEVQRFPKREHPIVPLGDGFDLGIEVPNAGRLPEGNRSGHRRAAVWIRHDKGRDSSGFWSSVSILAKTENVVTLSQKSRRSI